MPRIEKHQHLDDRLPRVSTPSHKPVAADIGSESLMNGETPFHLALVGLEGANTLLLSRLIGLEQGEIAIGMPVRARFRRRPQFRPTDVYFVPA